MKEGLLINDGHRSQAAARTLYTRRFWLAFVFSCWGLIQSAMWNFYSPISAEVKQVFGWSDSLIGLQANTAGIAFTVTIPFWAWVIDTRGSRVTIVIGCILLSICGALRCLPVPNHWHGDVVLVSMIFNGISAPPIALAPPILSASWFDSSERTAATAVMTTMNYLGQALGFIMGPAMVPASIDAATGRVLISAAATHRNLLNLYYAQAAIQFAITVAAVAYFPSTPPTPPTLSATDTKTDFSRGFSELLRHRRFWVLVVSFGLPIGIYGGNVLLPASFLRLHGGLSAHLHGIPHLCVAALFASRLGCGPRPEPLKSRDLPA